MKLLLALPAVLTGVLAAQNMTVDPGSWRQAGISLVSSSDPAFAGLASALVPSNAPNLAAAFPYSFVLTNGTGQAIIALGVRWICTDAAGHVRTHDRAWIDLITPTSSGTVAAGADRLVTPILSPGADADDDAVARELAGFQGAQSIAASLEAVILSDGTALGGDANNTVPRVEARLDAQKQVLAGIVAAWQQGGADALTTYLQGVVAAAPPPQGDMAAVNAPTPSAAYSMVLSDVQRQFAGGLIKKASSDPGGRRRFRAAAARYRKFPQRSPSIRRQHTTMTRLSRPPRLGLWALSLAFLCLGAAPLARADSVNTSTAVCGPCYSSNDGYGPIDVESGVAASCTISGSVSSVGMANGYSDD